MDLKTRLHQAIADDRLEAVINEITAEHLRTEYAFLVMDLKHGKRIKDAKTGEFVKPQVLMDFLSKQS